MFRDEASSANSAHVLQVIIFANEHNAAHRRVGANTNSRHYLHARNPLVLDDGNKRRFNFAARKQIAAAGGRGIGHQLYGTLHCFPVESSRLMALCSDNLKRPRAVALALSYSRLK